jgi:hypothetical protein
MRFVVAEFMGCDSEGAMKIDGRYMYGKSRMELISNGPSEKYYFSIVLCMWEIEISRSNSVRGYAASVRPAVTVLRLLVYMVPVTVAAQQIALGYAVQCVIVS